jgi:hypothetical protein
VGLADVRGSLLRAPTWVLSLVMGTTFGLAMFAVQLLEGSTAPAAAAGACLGGVFFGLVMGPFSRRMNNRFREATAGLPAAQQRAVRRAVMRGPVPADPLVRRSAAGVIAHQLALYRRMRWTPVLYLAFIASSLWLAASDSGWYALVALLFAGFGALHLWTPRHLERRRRLLSEETALPS